ncbi:MAG: peroxide stress protein YaaA, partial [Pseudomonadota bacterium]
GSRLKTRRGDTLYAYWRDQIARSLNEQAEKVDTDILVNCASQEYFGAADHKALKLTVVTPQFLELRAGAPKIISFFAKKARGAMARFVVQNRLTDPSDLVGFDYGGYAYDSDLSEPGKPAFVRAEPD